MKSERKLMMNKLDFYDMMKLSEGDTLLVNDKYVCTMLSSSFSEYAKNSSSPTLEITAIVNVQYDNTNGYPIHGMILVLKHDDIPMSAMLYMNDGSRDTWTKMINITKYNLTKEN